MGKDLDKITASIYPNNNYSSYKEANAIYDDMIKTFNEQAKKGETLFIKKDDIKIGVSEYLVKRLNEEYIDTKRYYSNKEQGLVTIEASISKEVIEANANRLSLIK